MKRPLRPIYMLAATASIIITFGGTAGDNECFINDECMYYIMQALRYELHNQCMYIAQHNNDGLHRHNSIYTFVLQLCKIFSWWFVRLSWWRHLVTYLYLHGSGGYRKVDRNASVSFFGLLGLHMVAPS